MELNGVYSQLERQTNKTQIVNLLREAQAHSSKALKETNSSGNKIDCLAALKAAVEGGYIKVDRLYQQLQVTEESGHQRIFMYRPPTPGMASKLANPMLIGNLLFGEDTWSLKDFPIFESVVNGMQVADFRIGLEGRPNDWILKFYEHERLKRSIGGVVTEDQGNNIIEERRQYRVLDVHSVHLVRWRHPGTLEIRIDLSGLRSEEMLEKRLDSIWSTLGQAIKREDLRGRNIDPILTSLLTRRADPDCANSYSIGQLELVDPGSGYHTVIPSESEAVDDEPSRSVILETATEQGLKPNALRVKWKKTENTPECFPEELDTAITKTALGPVLTVRKRTTYKALEYVFDQLRNHAKPTP